MAVCEQMHNAATENYKGKASCIAPSE